MPNVVCPACAKALKVPEAAVGKGGRCPSCQHRFTVPGEPQRPVTARPTEDAPAPPPSEPKKRKKKKRKPARREFPWRLAAAVGGVVALALVAVVAALALFGGGVGGVGDIAREPKADLLGTRSGFDSTVYEGEFLPADPATWAVKVEVADPAPPNLRATIPCPDEQGP